MVLRRLALLLASGSCLCPLGTAQKSSLLRPASATSSTPRAPDLRNVVLPITELKFLGLGIEVKGGTGFCVDPECRFIGTNYHVAALGNVRKIKGQKVVQRYLATGPEDDGATPNEGAFLVPGMKYTPSRDLAIFELRGSVPHYHGMVFSRDELQGGQEVEIYSYPFEGINPFRSLVQFHGKFKGQTPTGLLAFDYTLSEGKAIHPGASGGIVVDSKTQQIVGILNSVAKNDNMVALAVPVQSLADFLGKVEPYLAARIFPSEKYISPMTADLYPQFEPQTPSQVLEHRPEESPAIRQLRAKAQLLADNMRNFIAVQTFAWGAGNKAPAAHAAYEVRVLDGSQKYRTYPDGKEELDEVPIPLLNDSITPGSDWSDLPRMVGMEPRFKIQEAPDGLLDGKQIRVFRYRADPEDGVCRMRWQHDFGFFVTHKTETTSCYGEVWTDGDTNVLRISEHFNLRGKWKEYQTVVNYGWLRQNGEAPKLIPVTISAQIVSDKKVEWCRGQFTNYQVYSTKVRILSG